jgi:ribonucleoside-diphosphate reductase alpha chain
MKQLRLSKNALIVLQKRYLRKDARGRVIETPSAMFERVAANIASAEFFYDPRANVKATGQAFLRMMTQLEFLPNSPTLMNAGRELQQLSACFVLPVEDSLNSIFEAVKQTALIHQSGGGTGFSFSRLRPRNDRVLSTSGIASGPVSFMRVFNTATEVIKQGGTRRGANMGILRVDHPDIEEFITIKEDPSELTNFNLSVAVTDEFMRAVELGKDYSLINPRTGHSVKRASASRIFDLMVESAWKSGEPGVLFLDRINRDNPTPQIGSIEATNPCGEQPLLPYESCNLGSINLARLITRRGRKRVLNRQRLAELIRLGVRFLDNVIDMNRYPLPQIEQITKGNRKIGLGIMGFADFLIEQGIPYESQEALDTAGQLMKFVQQTAWEASEELAKERGFFPNFGGSVFDHPGRKRPRNATATTIAPTGTLSLIAHCSSGIEPLYAVSYVRTVMDQVRLLETHPLFLNIAKRYGFWNQKVQKAMTASESIQDIQEIPKEIRRLFLTAHDISPEFHARMQAAFQQYTDNAVSKTVNFPKTATPKDIRKAFLLAYHEGCKGITIYRSGSRERQVLSCTNTLYC